MICGTSCDDWAEKPIDSLTPFHYSEQMSDLGQNQTVYKVVINHEEQYSIWPEGRENPLGWREVGKSGMKEICLAYINEVWTDMRPPNVRKQMDSARSDRR